MFSIESINSYQEKFQMQGHSDLFARKQVLDHVTALNTKNNFSSDLDLASFIDLWQKNDESYSVDPNILIDGFLHLKKEQLAGEHGNAVNYFAQLARGIVSGSENEIRQVHADVVGNILSLVAEHPLAETVKVDTRLEQWDSNWQMKLGNSYLYTILEDALITSQKEDFEYERYQANKTNYQKLRNGRIQGDKRMFVEFSPSPSITPEAIKRGYMGNSCIFFYEFNPVTREETVTQRWLQANWSEFNDLLQELGYETMPNDIDSTIMLASDFFDSNDINIIGAFIDKHNGKISQNVSQIDDFVHGNLREFVDREIRDDLYRGALSLLEGEPITKYMSSIIDTLTYAQLRLRNELHNLTGVCTLTTGTEQIIQKEVSFDRFDQDAAARSVFISQNRDKLNLVGCGVNISEQMKQQLYSGGGSSFGGSSMGQAVFMDGNKSFSTNPENDPNLCRCDAEMKAHFHCPGRNGACNHAIAVGEDIVKCPQCGEGKRC